MHPKEPLSSPHQLPSEIVELILCHLQRKDLLSLRLSCSAFDRKTLRFFKTRYFTTKAIALTSDNLQTLIDVARHEDFGPQIQELVLGKPPVKPPIRRSRQAPLQHDACSYDDAKYVPYILEAEERLSAAMKHLPNLARITLSASYAGQPGSASCHLRIVLSAVKASSAVDLNDLTWRIPREAIMDSGTWPTYSKRPAFQRPGQQIPDEDVAGVTTPSQESLFPVDTVINPEKIQIYRGKG